MRPIFLLVGAILVTARPAYGCSVKPGYRIPTNIELIAQSDLVVLAAVVSDTDALDDIRRPHVFPPRIILRPIKSLKGKAPSELRVIGSLRVGGRPVPVFPTALDRVHPTTMRGGCIRQGYSQGSMVVAMFRKTAEGYVQLADPFARVIEDVSKRDDLWVRAAGMYVKLLRVTDDANRRVAFEAERKRLLADKSDPDAMAIAADIERYLKATETK